VVGEDTHLSGLSGKVDLDDILGLVDSLEVVYLSVTFLRAWLKTCACWRDRRHFSLSLVYDPIPSSDSSMRIYMSQQL
jgi:hypothetical protein